MSLEVVEASVVAVGSFNPPIISVDWLLGHRLIGEGDATTARESKDFVVTRQLTRYSTDTAKIQVIENQLSVASAGPVSPALADLATSILQLLPHTPVTALGLNFMVHYKIPTKDVYHRIGDTLAPKALWEELFPDRQVGLLNLVMKVQDGTRENGPRSRNEKNITVQPSGRVSSGVFLQANNHYAEDAATQPLANAAGAADLVRANWETDYQESLAIFASIIERIAGKEYL